MQNLPPPVITRSSSLESPLSRRAVANQQATPYRWKPGCKPPPPPLCCKPPLRVRPVVASLQPGNQGTIFNYLLFNVLILEIYFLGLIINIQILSITLLNLKNKFQEFTWLICESNIYNI